MSFNWEEFLDVARQLDGEARGRPEPPLAEAKLRCSMSRAYYAAHTCSRNFLIEVDNLLIERTGAAHRRVIDEFNAKPHLREIAQVLQRLLGWRNAVDYKDRCPFNLELQSEAALKQAKKVVDRVATERQRSSRR